MEMKNSSARVVKDVRDMRRAERLVCKSLMERQKAVIAD